MHSSSSAVNLALNALNIRVPNCVASSMRMAYVVTEMNALTANITFSHLDLSIRRQRQMCIRDSCYRNERPYRKYHI